MLGFPVGVDAKVGQERTVAGRGLERDRQPTGVARHHDQLIGEPGGRELFSHPGSELIVTDAADQAHVHAGFDGRERGVRAGAADTDGHLVGQQRAAG